MKDFSFKKHKSYILWTDTLWHNGLRAFAAGIVWCIILLLQHKRMDAAIILMPIIIPISYFIFYVPIGVFCSILSDLGVPIIGIFTMIINIIIMPGDPAVYILHKINPKWVPAKEPHFIGLSVVVFILDDERMAQDGLV